MIVMYLARGAPGGGRGEVERGGGCECDGLIYSGMWPGCCLSLPSVCCYTESGPGTALHMLANRWTDLLAKKVKGEGRIEVGGWVVVVVVVAVAVAVAVVAEALLVSLCLRGFVTGGSRTEDGIGGERAVPGPRPRASPRVRCVRNAVRPAAVYLADRRETRPPGRGPEL
ncbi:unnamed protein product [Gadus morhua 'NCC']